MLRWFPAWVLAAMPATAYGLAGELDQPAVGYPADYTKGAQRQLQAVLERPGCKFLGGSFVNSFTTLRYSSSTRELNLFMDELVKCPRVMLHVSFVKALPQEGDWHLHHSAMPGDFSFHVRISLASKKIDLTELVIPEIRVGRVAPPLKEG